MCVNMTLRLGYLTECVKEGVSLETAEKTYLHALELNRKIIFRDTVPSVLKLNNVETLDKGTRYYWESESVEAMCPHCKTASHRRRRGDQVKRTSQDKPMGNGPVFHEVLTNRYYCENKSCPIKIFTERFPGFVEEKIRVTNRFKEYCMDQHYRPAVYRPKETYGKKVASYAMILWGDT